MKTLFAWLIPFICFFGMNSSELAITEMTPPYALPHSAYGNTYDRYFTY